MSVLESTYIGSRARYIKKVTTFYKIYKGKLPSWYRKILSDNRGVVFNTTSIGRRLVSPISVEFCVGYKHVVIKKRGNNLYSITQVNFGDSSIFVIGSTIHNDYMNRANMINRINKLIEEHSNDDEEFLKTLDLYRPI